EPTDHDAVGHSCAHCDAAEDHHALDEKGIVDTFRSMLRTTGIVRIIIAVAGLGLGLWWAPPAVLAGVGGWVLATGVGILALSFSAPRYGTTNSVIIGTVIAAALLPLAAWASATWVGHSPTIAFAGAGGWFLAVAIVETLRDRNLASILIADSRDGEAARQAVLFSNPVFQCAGLGWSVFTAIL